MQFRGEESFECHPTELWDRVTDMEFLSGIVPDLDRVELIEPKQLVCRVRPGFSFSFRFTQVDV